MLQDLEALGATPEQLQQFRQDLPERIARRNNMLTEANQRQAYCLAAGRKPLVLSEAELLRVQYCRTILRPHAQIRNYLIDNEICSELDSAF